MLRRNLALSFASVTVAALLHAPLAQAQVATIFSESFDYAVGPLGGQNGGVGWSEPWDAGVQGNDGQVLSPGFDPVGNKVVIDPANGFAVCFRRPDTGPWGPILTNGKFGADGTTLWISFDSRRAAGAACQFGGFSLYDDNSERLFIGSPWQSFGWGIDDHVATGISLIPGSSSDQLTHVVVRIDYQVGFERLRMWLDPANPYPGTVADLDTSVGNHPWNRIRIASGTSLPNGYEFDAIRVEVEMGALGTNYCGPAIPNSTGAPATITAAGSSLVANNDVTLTASGLPPGEFGYFLTSQTQGFFNPPGSNGFICLGGNIGRYNQPANVGQGPSFDVLIDLTSIPINPPHAVQPGESWNFQCWYRDLGGNNFTEGLAILFQ